MKTNNKILSFIGLCMKAGKLVSGEFSVEKAVKGKKAHLVVVADDVSANSRKMYTDMCSYYKVPIRFLATKEELGRILGKEYRASLAVLDEQMALALLKKIEDSQN